MIFAIFKTYRDVKKGVANPTGLGQEALLEVLSVPLFIFTIGGGLFIVFLGLLGWSELLGGPFGFFKFLCVFLGVPFLILTLIFWSLFSRVKKLVRRAKERVDEEIKTIKVEPK